jgi:hypothetical protein
MCVVAVACLATACSGGDDDDHTSTTTTAHDASTTTIPIPGLADRGQVGTAFPQPRFIAVRGVERAPGARIAFATHPNNAVTSVRASSNALELCPATTDGAIALTGAWPEYVHFDSCRPLADGVPSPGPGFHVGWAVRATGTSTLRNLQLTISYEAADGFFAWFPPSTCGVVTVVPDASDIVALWPTGTEGVNGLEVRQRGRPLSVGFDGSSGRAVLITRAMRHEPVSITCAKPPPDGGGLVIDWV